MARQDGRGQRLHRRECRAGRMARVWAELHERLPQQRECLDGPGLSALCLATAATSGKRPLIACMRVSSACYTPHEGDARLERSAVAATGCRRFVRLLDGHAPADMALSRSRAPAAFSPDPVRRCFAPPCQKREFELRHAVLQAVEGLLLQEIGQERAPGRSRMDRHVAVSRRLRTTPCGVRNSGGESGSGSGRGQTDHPRVACENPGRITTQMAWDWSRSL